MLSVPCLLGSSTIKCGVSLLPSALSSSAAKGRSGVFRSSYRTSNRQVISALYVSLSNCFQKRIVARYRDQVRSKDHKICYHLDGGGVRHSMK